MAEIQTIPEMVRLLPDHLAGFRELKRRTTPTTIRNKDNELVLHLAREYQVEMNGKKSNTFCAILYWFRPLFCCRKTHHFSYQKVAGPH
jgi:hypothetical protein